MIEIFQALLNKRSKKEHLFQCGKRILASNHSVYYICNHRVEPYLVSGPKNFSTINYTSFVDLAKVPIFIQSLIS
jgi:hypothetical protein